MARAPGLLDVDERLQRLSNIGDQLEAYAAVVDFEIFRADLIAALDYSDGAKGGRPPFDPVMMFKIRVIQAQNNLSDDRAEFMIHWLAGHCLAMSREATTGFHSCASSALG